MSTNTFVGLPIFWCEDQQPRVSATTLSKWFNIDLAMQVRNSGHSFFSPISKIGEEELVSLGNACGILWRHQNHPQTLYQQFCEELESIYTTTSAVAEPAPHVLQVWGISKTMEWK